MLYNRWLTCCAEVFKRDRARVRNTHLSAGSGGTPESKWPCSTGGGGGEIRTARRLGTVGRERGGGWMESGVAVPFPLPHGAAPLSVETPTPQTLVGKIILQMHTPASTSQCWSQQTPAWTRSVHLDAPGHRHGQQPAFGTADPEVVKQDKSSGGSVDTTKTRSGPRRVRMYNGERPIGAAKSKQMASCQNPPTQMRWACSTATAEARPAPGPEDRGNSRGTGGTHPSMSENRSPCQPRAANSSKRGY